MQGALCLTPQLYKPGVVWYACDPNTQEVVAEGSRVQSQPWIHMQLQANLGYRRPRFQKTKTKKPQPTLPSYNHPGECDAV